MSIKPQSRPKASRDEILKYLVAAGVDLAKEKVAVVGIRGYYKDTMGTPFVNDRNLYDDAFFVLTETGMTAFNGNVDPSKFRKGIASLVAGLYRLVKHRHKGKYDALTIVVDTVTRDGQAGTDKGHHAINFHYGGDFTTTGSEGCQTLPKSQWPEYQHLVYGLMDKFKLASVAYLLVEN